MGSAPARGRRSDWLTTTVMTAPAVVVFAAMVVVPIVISVYLSLTDWDGYSANPHLVGLANYASMFTDDEVITSAVVTLIVAVVGTLALNLIGLGFALLVNRSDRLSRLLRMLLFYPHVLSALVVGFLWGAILGTNGAVNQLVTAHGGEVLPFLSDPNWAVLALLAVLVWAGFGVNVLLYLAGLQTVSPELLEAARIDGAGRWQVFRAVTAPALRPSVTLNVVLSLVTLLKTYDLVVSLTGGGPAGRTQTVAYLILWNSFHNSRLGAGSAQSVVLMVVTALLALSVVKLRQRGDLAALR
ncbi:carbohydrate ABC transporter permease [Rugosimonospora acidiphila]|uniref:carbohydrate ABC transporter permease n=1 Tax=Rugosimonospora acidiphila TaxID=556531 RepID=UPI0031EEB8B7